jgi:hypothetical protein
MDLQQVPEITDVRSVRPDVSADVVIDANYINEAGATISIDIAGSGADDYDHLTILGSASIDGAVILNFINGFTPSDGDLYDLFTFDDLLNDFSDNIQVDGLAPGWQYELIQNGDEYEIESLSDGLPAPEPGLSALLVTGGLLLGRRRRAGWR